MNENTSIKTIFTKLMIDKVPSYANKFFYSLGFLSMICFLMLIVTGVIMVSYGPSWWLTSSYGQYLRSVHLWATQGFVFFILLHLIIVFLSSGFKKPRRLTWVVGALMFFFVMAEAEFGYVLRGDYSSQYRALQGADLFNGAGIGGFLNELNFRQIYGIHIVVVPLIIIGLLFVHYVLIKARGIAKPYKKDVSYRMVNANHNLLFIRGGILTISLLILAWLLPSPYLAPITIQQIAQQDPSLSNQTLITEFTKTSGTATYLDNIDPYSKFDTKSVFIDTPYIKYVQSAKLKNYLKIYNSNNSLIQQSQVLQASDYFNNKIKRPINNSVVNIIESLTLMSQAGTYETALIYENPSGDQSTYITRYLSDTGVLSVRADELGITTAKYGMLKEETSSFPLGAWWLAPIGILNHTILANDNNSDRDGAIIIGLLVMLMIAYPFIPGLNVLPDKIHFYKIIWRDKK